MALCGHCMVHTIVWNCAHDQSIWLYGWWFVQIQMTALNPCMIDLYNGMDSAVWICTIVQNPVRLPLQKSDGPTWLVCPSLYRWWFVQIQMTALNPCTVDLYNGMDCAVWIFTIVWNPVRLPLQTSNGSAWLVRSPYKCLSKCFFSLSEKLEVQCLSLSNSMLEFHSCDGVSSSLSSVAFDTIEMNQNPNSNY